MQVGTPVAGWQSVGDHSVLASTTTKVSKGGDSTYKKQTKGGKKCTHYGRTNHLVETCWELYPEKKPTKFKRNQ